MRSPTYEEGEREAEKRLFRRGAMVLIALCHTLSLLQWTCYLLGGSFWGG